MSGHVSGVPTLSVAKTMTDNDGLQWWVMCRSLYAFSMPSYLPKEAKLVTKPSTELPAFDILLDMLRNQLKTFSYNL